MKLDELRESDAVEISTVKVLLIENDPADAERIQQALSNSHGCQFQVKWVQQIADAITQLKSCNASSHNNYDVVLLDLTLPEGQGLDAFNRLFKAAPDALILIMSNSDDEEIAAQAVEQGAFDYLSKNHVNAHWLPRALRYVTERKAAEAVLKESEEALFEAKERAQVTLNSIGDAVIATDESFNVTYLNLMAETMTGWQREEAVGHPLTEVFDIIHSETRDIAENPAQRAIREDKTVGLAADSVLIRRDGHESAIEDSSAPIHNRQGQVTGAVIVFHDVSASKTMAQKMTHLAQHDALTGLPNRLLLQERLAQSIGQAKRHRRQVALLFLDLDYFKYINDSLGHAIGDQLLISVAQRFQACIRATDTVCRQGGDEFVVLLTEIEHPRDAAQVAAKILATQTKPHLIGAHELHVSLSIGISVYPNDGDDVDSIMKCADTAMYHAKASGRNNYQFFRAEMNVNAVHRMHVETDLRRAMRNQEFLMHYQPQIDLASGEMTGAEALIRWRDPKLGLINPDQFVPIAEECGLIVPIGRWVLRDVCMQVRSWLDAGLRAVPVAVNVSAIELRHQKFVEGVANILAETNLPAHYLKLELTESVLIHDAESSYRTLAALRDMGVKLAIDDFGTGYSSLSYLKRFPIDAMKIDRSFVRDMVTDADDAAIVGAVISMGRNLHQQVIAEGVETREQLAILRSHQCETVQGYHFSRPMNAVDFELLLTAKQEGQSSQLRTAF